jgi:hypothetical protein
LLGHAALQKPQQLDQMAFCTLQVADLQQHGSEVVVIHRKLR